RELVDLKIPVLRNRHIGNHRHIPQMTEVERDASSPAFLKFFAPLGFLGSKLQHALHPPRMIRSPASSGRRNLAILTKQLQTELEWVLLRSVSHFIDEALDGPSKSAGSGSPPPAKRRVAGKNRPLQQE